MITKNKRKPIYQHSVKVEDFQLSDTLRRTNITFEDEITHILQNQFIFLSNSNQEDSS